MEPFMGMIAVFGFNFAPRGWMSAGGQTLSIAQYTALFSLLNIQFGGDGKTNFMLPNLQGRTIIGYNGTYPMGDTGGSATVTLTQAQMPAHTHGATFTPSSSSSASVQASQEAGKKTSPDAGDYVATGFPNTGPNAIKNFIAPADAGTTVALGGVNGGGAAGTITVANSGNGQSFNNMMPYLAMNPCVAIEGYYPSRD